MHIGGTTRTTTVENRAMVERRIREICAGAAAMHGVDISVEHRAGYGPTINDADKAQFAADVAAEVCGEANILRTVKPSMGAEDFSYMLNAVPGAMVWLGNGMTEQGLHNPAYDFNDQAIPFGVSFFARAAERFLT